MQVIFLSQRHQSVHLRLPHILFWLTSGLSLCAAALVALGYMLGADNTRQQTADRALVELRTMLQQAQDTVAQVRSDQDSHLNTLGLRVAGIQARMMRIDALGERMVRIGGLNQAEFDFSVTPAMGGNPEETGTAQNIGDIRNDLDQMSALLADREHKLEALESYWLNRDLLQAAFPSGRPVQQGWISSRFGARTDPINGYRSHHKGVDFAAQSGTPIHAVAAGIVQRSGTMNGFGNVVEISHADGYSTLYAHNKKNLVRRGDIVHKGQVVALLGSSGRSSGPHVHFEVRKDGRPVNPHRYIQATSAH